MEGSPASLQWSGARKGALTTSGTDVPRSGRPSPPPTSADDQLALFGVMTHPVVQQLRNVEPNTMTPIQALDLLARLVDEVKLEKGVS